MSRWFLLSLLILILDQLTKYFAEDYLTLTDVIPIVPGLNLVLAYNPGIAFSLFAGAGFWLAIIAAVVSVFLAVWIQRLPAGDRLTGAALAAVFGGALGNLADRVFRDGLVVDFIDVYIWNWHWPAFNVADSAICVGAGLLIFTAFFPQPEIATDRTA
ncbi:MAG: signal peptidase II [Chromatiales bacterium]|jgi:signal peptidase II|nr:signal peptidase II [Chromatiales bacterium]